MLCNYLEVASAIMPIKIPKTIMGIKLVIIEIPKVAKRDLLICDLTMLNIPRMYRLQKLSLRI